MKAGNLAPSAWQLREDWAGFKVFSGVFNDLGASNLVYILQCIHRDQQDAGAGDVEQKQQNVLSSL